MQEEFIDYGILMNERSFRIFVQDYYSPTISPFFTGQPIPKPIQNGVEVDADIYNQHEGITEYAEEGIVRHPPLQVGSEYDMTISYANCAQMVDMCINEITFTIDRTEDVNEAQNIMCSYREQIIPFETSNRNVRSYQPSLNQAIHLIENNLEQRLKAEKADDLAKRKQSNQPLSLADIIGSCF